MININIWVLPILSDKHRFNQHFQVSIIKAIFLIEDYSYIFFKINIDSSHFYLNLKKEKYIFITLNVQ